MKKRLFAAALALSLALGALEGCGRRNVPETTASAQTQQSIPETEPETAPPATTPPDGNPGDVTCKGTYTGVPEAGTVVARAGEGELTNGQLQAWYWAAVGQYVRSGQEPQPDLSADLAAQACEIDGTVGSWQQYFLRQALNAWHTAQALVLESGVWQRPLEDAFQPNEKNHEKYMTDMPANHWLYGYDRSYSVNIQHQAYLDGLDGMLISLAGEKGYADAEELARKAFGATLADLKAAAELYNRGYMFFTEETYYLGEPTGEEVEEYLALNGIREEGKRVDIRHVLLLPEGARTDAAGIVTASEEAWADCEALAEKKRGSWSRTFPVGEASFANIAHAESQDPGSAVDGGSYRNLKPGQLPQALDEWCFAEERKTGDTAVLRSPYGVHILYFSGAVGEGEAQARQALEEQAESALIEQAREAWPMEVDYRAITLAQAAGTVSAGELLYPDLEHERYPEVPLYLQQDYPSTMYGGYKIVTHGCGITSLAMLASYMADEELTPPMLCARYGRYCTEHGTEGSIFARETPDMGFYLKEKVFQPSEALEALKEGHIVISSQKKGYWTRGGHYIVLEKINEDGNIQVRDSNIYNYGRISAHQQDEHTWTSITGAGAAFYIYEYKITALPSCVRCGEPEALTPRIVEGEYICRKCLPAVMRRDTYLVMGTME